MQDDVTDVGDVEQQHISDRGPLPQVRDVRPDWVVSALEHALEYRMHPLERCDS